MQLQCFKFKAGGRKMNRCQLLVLKMSAPVQKAKVDSEQFLRRRELQSVYLPKSKVKQCRDKTAVFTDYNMNQDHEAEDAEKNRNSTVAKRTRVDFHPSFDCFAFVCVFDVFAFQFFWPHGTHVSSDMRQVCSLQMRSDPFHSAQLDSDTDVEPSQRWTKEIDGTCMTFYWIILPFLQIFLNFWVQAV